jgi:hypothetical protein
MTLPEGLVYAPGFLTEAEERDVLAMLAAFELYPYVLHDTPSRRLVRSFGRALVAGAYDAGPPQPGGLRPASADQRCCAACGAWLGVACRSGVSCGGVCTVTRETR